MMRNSSVNQSLLDPTQSGNPTWIHIWVFYHKYKRKRSLCLRHSECVLLNQILPQLLPHRDDGQMTKKKTDVLRDYTQTVEFVCTMEKYSMLYFLVPVQVTKRARDR